MLSIGIDVSKGKSTVCGMKPGGEIGYTPFEVQHTRNHITTTRTGFTFTTTSRRTGGDDPLSDYVYSSIKESLEDVFGSMR